MDSSLQASYARCRKLNARHGRTYFLATRLLPPARRPAVHALYAFARWADDIVDSMTDTRPWPERAAELAALEQDLKAELLGEPSGHPILPALRDSAIRYELDPQHFSAFFDAMRMDAVGSHTEVSEYTSMEQLETYMYGSAAVVGLLMLPVLGVRGSRDEAAPFAAALGVAFQLTNFLRDVGEDLDRGRVYLPADELAAFGVDRQLLAHVRATAAPETRVRRALAHLVAVTRSRYREAEAGIGLLDPVARPCVRTAFTLYGDILTEIERTDYHVLSRRVAVSRRRRLAVAGPGLFRAAAIRRATRTPIHWRTSHE